MNDKLYMNIIVEFSDGIYYEAKGEELNPKQIELIAHMLGIPKMLDAEKGS